MNFQYFDRNNIPITSNIEFLTYQIHTDRSSDFYGFRGPLTTIVKIVVKYSESLPYDIERMITIRGNLKIRADMGDIVLKNACLESYSTGTPDYRTGDLLCDIAWKSINFEPNIIFNELPRFWRYKPVKEAIEEVNWMKEGF